MNRRRNTLIVLSLLNLAAVTGIFWSIAAHRVDQSIVVFVFYYPLLIAVNAVLWFLMKVLDHPAKVSMKYVLVTLLLLALPLTVLAYFLGVMGLRGH